MVAFDHNPNTMLKETERNPECDSQSFKEKGCALGTMRFYVSNL